MARGVNKVILIGNVGKDPELRYTQNGTAVCNFSLATTERAKIQGEWQDKTEWHNIVAWSRLAELCNQYLQKGTQVYIEGRLQTRKWEDREGNTRYQTEIVAQDVQFLSRTRQEGAPAARRSPSPSPAAPADAFSGPEDFPGPDDPGFDPNDDVPF
ncbi:MAG: single-stranded DNA-binding protein [Deltaproteobacteria bacterium]|nr:single-stranded DNA-binding protein [Deltaproteobacteria bacterium]